MEFYDDFDGAASGLDGRVAPTGQAWGEINGHNNGYATLYVDGSDTLIRTDDGAGVGAYGDVTISASPVIMRATASWLGTSADITENGAVVLISGSTNVRNGSPPQVGIWSDCLHAVFGLWQTTVRFYEGGVAGSTLISYNYAGGPLLSDGTQYELGLIFDGERLIVEMPDGTRKFATSTKLPTLSGKYLIWQIYKNVSPNLYPQFNYVEASITPRVLPTNAGLYPI